MPEVATAEAKPWPGYIPLPKCNCAIPDPARGCQCYRTGLPKGMSQCRNPLTARFTCRCCGVRRPRCYGKSEIRLCNDCLPAHEKAQP